MKPENLKKLLHQNRHKLSKNHFKEDQLNIRYIKINDLKTTNKASAFNIERNKVIDEQLNKYMHPNSVHIRLKPYFDSGTWIKWIGVLGDVTLPNKTNLNGSLLIDKISCYSDKVEILDYHAWLNEVKDVKVVDSGRLVFARYSLPYVGDIKKLGELRTDDQISFYSEAAPNSSNSFNMVTNFELLTEHDFIPLPSNPNAFLGYIMWRHPEEGESTYIANYQNWALAKQIHTEEIDHEIDSIRPTSNLTEPELATNLNIDQKLIANARKQGLIKPVTSNGLTIRYDSNAWNLLRQVIGAQDNTTIEHLKQIYPIYTTDDIVKKTGVDRSEVDTRIRQEEFFPLNGLHCSINIYGPKVFDLFKTRKTVQDLLPNKTGVATKREIPVNKSLHEVIEKAEAENKEKQKAEVTEPKKPAIKFSKRAEPKPQITEPQPKVEESTPAATSSIIIISTFADEKYDYVAADANKAIAEIIAAAEKTMVNKMLQVKDHTTGQPAIISVKAIMKMECK